MLLKNLHPLKRFVSLRTLRLKTRYSFIEMPVLWWAYLKNLQERLLEIEKPIVSF